MELTLPATAMVNRARQIRAVASRLGAIMLIKAREIIGQRWLPIGENRFVTASGQHESRPGPGLGTSQTLGDRALRRPVLWNDLAAVAEAVDFAPPEETPAGKTAQPDKKAQQVTQRI